MATLLPNDRVGRSELRGYRVFVFSHDHPHPAHVHFGKGTRVSSWDLVAKAWRDGDGFSPAEIREQRMILRELAPEIWRSWHAHWQRQRQEGGDR